MMIEYVCRELGEANSLPSKSEASNVPKLISGRRAVPTSPSDHLGTVPVGSLCHCNLHIQPH